MEDSYTSDATESRKRVEALQTEIEDLEMEIEEIEERLNTENNDAANAAFEEDKEVKENELEEKKQELQDLREQHSLLEPSTNTYDEVIAAEKGKLKNIIEDGESRLAQIQKQQKQIDEELQEIENRREQINELESNIEELQQTAEGLLERTTSGALGEQFEDRQKELQKDLQFWLRASLASIGILIVVSLIVYADIALSPENAVISISKLALLLPVSVIVWFSVTNYSRTRKLMEEYEFKARIGLSLNGFREVLRSELPEEQSEEVAKFVSETMDKMYSNPQKNIDGEQPQEQQDPLPTGQKPLVEFIKRLGNN